MDDPRIIRLIEVQRELDLRKALYEEYDRLVLALQADGFKEATVEASAEHEKLTIALIDNFADKNTGWTSAAVKRYSVIIEPSEKHQARKVRAEKRAAR